VNDATGMNATLSKAKREIVMKLIVIALVLAGAIYSSGCERPVCDCRAFPNGDTIRIGIKEKADVYGCCEDRFAILFSNVKEDSRCPDGFNCIAMNPVWAGTAKIAVNINLLQPLELEINKPAVTKSNGYTYTLLLTDLTPHPKSGLPTDPNSYQAMIVVNRN
jgi:hypothetical protein